MAALLSAFGCAGCSDSAVDPMTTGRLAETAPGSSAVTPSGAPATTTPGSAAASTGHATTDGSGTTVTAADAVGGDTEPDGTWPDPTVPPSGTTSARTTASRTRTPGTAGSDSTNSTNGSNGTAGAGSAPALRPDGPQPLADGVCIYAADIPDGAPVAVVKSAPIAASGVTDAAPRRAGANESCPAAQAAPDADARLRELQTSFDAQRLFLGLHSGLRAVNDCERPAASVDYVSGVIEFGVTQLLPALLDAARTSLAVEFVLAHEHAHHVQYLRGLHDFRDASHGATVRRELTADAFAAQLVHAMSAQRARPSPDSPQAVPELLNLVWNLNALTVAAPATGLYWHGTQLQRRAAVGAGFATARDMQTSAQAPVGAAALWSGYSANAARIEQILADPDCQP